MQNLRRQSIAVRVVAAIAVVFGVATIKAGGSVLFGGIDAARGAGNFVPFVVWFNFLAGFVYIAAGAGLWVRRRWAVILAAALAAGTALTFVAFGMHVVNGGAYEMRTVWALTLRLAVWSAITLFARRVLWTRRALETLATGKQSRPA